MSESAEIYCLAPWVHSFINTKGKRNLCCFRDHELNEVTEKDLIPFKDYWNSDSVKKDRLNMLNNLPGEKCYPCDHRVLYNDHPRNFFFNKYQTNEVIEEIRNKTDEFGETSFVPRFLDYRFSNTCNFSCRMCAPGASSRVEAEEKQFNTNLQGRPSYNEFRKSINEEHIIDEVQSLLKLGQVDQFYWAGGEPLITPEHWETMQLAIDLDCAKNIDVTYNTNFSLINFKQYNLIDICSHFKSVKMLISLDGVGEVGEYIRKGLKWNEFKERLKEFRQLSNHEIKLTITITLPGLLYIKDLAEFIVQEELDYDVHICHSNGPHDLLSPMILPRELLHPLVDNAMRELNDLDNTRLDGLFKNISKLIERRSISEEFPENFEERFSACRKFYLKKEEGSSLSLESIYGAKSIDIKNWWARDIAFEDPNEYKLSNYQKGWVEVQLADSISKKRVQQISEEGGGVSEYLKKNHELEISSLNELQADSYSHLMITNSSEVYTEPAKLLSKLSNSLNKGGTLSMIVPSSSLLNKILNKENTDLYYKKIGMDDFLNTSIEGSGWKALKKEPFSPWGFLINSSNSNLGKIWLGSLFDYFLSPLNKVFSIHTYWLLQKDKK